MSKWATFRLGIINEGFVRRDVTAIVNRAFQAHTNFERKAAAGSLKAGLFCKTSRPVQGCDSASSTISARATGCTVATYLEGSGTFARYALLLALIVCEGAANAYFFSQGMTSGLIGGFIGAALNLVVAFVLGKFAVPGVFHRDRAIKALGVIAIALAIASITALGLTIAHFRDALIAGAAEPAKAAWTALQAAPFALRNVNSWFLFCISILFAVFALADGLSSDDSYPGYGRIDRRARASRDEYLEELQHARERLEELKDEELAALDEGKPERRQSWSMRSRSRPAEGAQPGLFGRSRRRTGIFAARLPTSKADSNREAEETMRRAGPRKTRES